MIRQIAGLTAAVAAMSISLLTPTVCLAQRSSASGMVAGPAGPAIGAAGSRAASGGVRKGGTRINTNRSRPLARSSATGTDTTRQSEDAIGLGGGFPLSLQDLLGVMPNNGFDWQYVNSINQDLGIKAFIDPVTQIEVAQAERLLRNTRGGFAGAYILGGGGYYVPPEQGEEEGGPAPAEGQPPEAQPSQNPQPQPQIIVLQQAPAQAQQAGPQGETEAQSQEEAPDRGPFTLVLRDGRQIQAVAFTHAKGKLIYITPEGGRLSFDATELDSDATTRVNEERGTPLQLPL
jgi:hypothetical protein